MHARGIGALTLFAYGHCMRFVTVPAQPFALPAVLLIAACGGTAEPADPLVDIDPVVRQALGDNLLTDPDLVGQNEASAALTVGTDQSVPAEIATQEAIREARDRAIAQLGGRDAVPELPEPRELAASDSDAPLVMLIDQAAALPDSAACLASARFSTVWAARLPDTLPVFPRGATREALGSDRQQCRLRAVRFHTPVPAADVLRFYYGKASEGGYQLQYAARGERHLLEGEGADTRFALAIRPSLAGSNEVDLVVGAR